MCNSFDVSYLGIQSYTLLVKKFGIIKIFLMLLKKVAYADQGCIYLIRGKTVWLWNIIII